MNLIHGTLVCSISLVLWLTLFILFKKLLKKYNFSRNVVYDDKVQCAVAINIVSSMQGVVSSCVGAYIIGQCGHDVIKASLPITALYAWVGLAYFIYDTWALFQLARLQTPGRAALPSLRHLWASKPVILAHHLLLVCVLCPSLIRREGVGDFFVGCFYCLELSALFTNTRNLLSVTGHKASRLYTANALLMVASFALCRVAVFPYMFWRYGCYVAEEMRLAEGPQLATEADAASAVALMLRGAAALPARCLLCSAAVLAPQLYWLSLMLRGAAAVLRGKPARE